MSPAIVTKHLIGQTDNSMPLNVANLEGERNEQLFCMRAQMQLISKIQF